MTKSSLDIETKKRIVDKILESSEFAKSQKYRKLLTYLADASIKGENVKSSTLAFDFFGKEASFDPTIDSTVRSYISNLRKKLEHFYLTEGEKEKYKVVIPKGNYHLEFEENILEQKTKSKNLNLFLIFTIALLSALSIFLLYKNFSLQYKSSLSAFDSPLWKDFFSNGKKTLFIIGDYYVYKLNMIEGKKTYVRDIQINSDEDLTYFVKKFPEYKSKIEPTSNAYLDESVPVCLATILPAFILNDIDFEIKLASDLQLEDLQNNNTIYIGSHKSLGLLNLFTRNLNFEYQILPGGITYHDNKKDSLYHYYIEDTSDSLARRDFPVVIRETGPQNNAFLFFLSIHDLGNISTVKYFTNPKSTKTFAKLYNTKNFVALFESRGYRREDFSIKLLHVNKLPSRLELPIH